MGKKGKETEVQTEETVAPTGDTETTIEPAQLTIQDLTALSNIVDLASRRGAFQAREMESVGAAFNKLTAFLNFIAEQAKASESDGEGDSGEAE